MFHGDENNLWVIRLGLDRIIYREIDVQNTYMSRIDFLKNTRIHINIIFAHKVNISRIVGVFCFIKL